MPAVGMPSVAGDTASSRSPEIGKGDSHHDDHERHRHIGGSRYARSRSWRHSPDEKRPGEGDDSGDRGNRQHEPGTPIGANHHGYRMTRGAYRYWLPAMALVTSSTLKRA